MQKPWALPAIVAAVVASVLAALNASAGSGPNLLPFQPSGWSDKIVVTRTNGGVIDSPNLLSTDTLYVDWSVINTGTAATIPFYVALYIDGVSNTSTLIPSLNGNFYYYITGHQIGSLSPGSHTLTVVADATGVETGDNEADNSYTKTISVSPVVLPAPAPSAPAVGATAQPVVPAFTWTAVSGAAAYRVLIASNAADLPSSTTASKGGPGVVINAVAPANSFSPTMQLAPGTTYYWEVHAVEQNDEDGAWSAVESFTTGALPAGLTIIPTFDSTITGDSNAAAIEATINAAISVYRESFSDPITVAITFTEMSDGLGYNDTYYNIYSYSAYRAALVSHATTADDATALAHLPAGPNNPVNGNSQMYINLPLARALGLGSGSPPGGSDSTIYLNTSIMNLSSTTTDPSKYSLFATVSHEMDEAIGFGSALNGLTNGAAEPTGLIEPEDLFRYDQNGIRSLTTSLNATSFFSLDGVTNLAQFNQYEGGDFGDWYSYDVALTPQVQDAFAPPGANPILAVELRGLDVIGYTRVLALSTVAAAVLNNASVSGGNLHFTLTGSIGTNYVVQYSSDLATWFPLSTNTIPAGGSANLAIAVASNPHRFYRAVSH